MESREESIRRLVRSYKEERAEIARRPTPRGIARGHTPRDIAVRAVDAELRERPSKHLEHLRVDLLSMHLSRGPSGTFWLDLLIDRYFRALLHSGRLDAVVFCRILLLAKRQHELSSEHTRHKPPDPRLAFVEEMLSSRDAKGAVAIHEAPDEDDGATTRKDRFEQFLKDAGRHQQECPHDSARSLASCLVGKGAYGFSVDTASRILRGTYEPATSLGFKRFPGLDL